MRRLALRVSMVLVGFVVLLVYLVGAAVAFLLVRSLVPTAVDLTGTVVAVVVTTVVFAALSYRLGTARTLASLDAVPVPRQQAPRLHRRLDALTERMDVSQPVLYVASLSAPNALALGGAREGALVLDRSLFRLLNEAELSAIVAHELAHLESRDSFVQTLALTCFRTLLGLFVVLLLPVSLLVRGVGRGLAWAVGRPANWPGNPVDRLHRGGARLLLALLVGVTVVVRAHSRRREFAADDRAVEVTGDPLALVRALRRIERAGRPRRGLLSPLYVHTDEPDRLTRLLATHPPMDDRVERLVARAEAETAPGRPLQSGPTRR
jgi:heat shock protein HtpX